MDTISQHGKWHKWHAASVRDLRVTCKEWKVERMNTTQQSGVQHAAAAALTMQHRIDMEFTILIALRLPQEINMFGCLQTAPRV